MNMRTVAALLILVCSGALALELTDIGGITRTATRYSSGDWVKVNGVVDTVYDSSTYLLSDSTGSIQVELCGYQVLSGDTIAVVGVLDPTTRNGQSIMEVETKLLYKENELLWERYPDRLLPEKYVASAENRAFYSVKRQQIICGAISSTVAITLPTIYGVLKARDKAEHEEADTTVSSNNAMSGLGEMDIDFGLEGFETAGTIMGVAAISIFTITAITQFSKAGRVPELERKDGELTLGIAPRIGKGQVEIALIGRF